MKRFLLVMAMMLSMVLFTTCSKDDGVTDDSNEQEETEYSIIGVWEDGEHFVSFSENGFYAAYLNDKFIDSGEYERDKNNVICVNLYKNSKTEIKVSLDGEILKAVILYTQFNGEKEKETRLLKKSDRIPAEKENPLIGKSVTNLNAYYGKCTAKFDTYNSATYSTEEAKPKVQNWYYFYFDSKAYFQRFKPELAGLSKFYEECDNGDVNVYKVEFDSNGQISKFDISNDK